METTVQDLVDKTQFDVWTTLSVRYRDLDLMGHVNHAVIVSYFEQARNGILDGLPLPESDGMVLGELHVRYLAEIARDSIVEIGTGVSRLGGRSFTLGQAAFVGETCVATCLGTLVYISRETRRAAEMPPAFREHLEKFLL